MDVSVAAIRWNGGKIRDTAMWVGGENLIHGLFEIAPLQPSD